MVKIRLLALALTACLPASAGAAAYGNFPGLVSAANLKPFALDLGGLLGSSGFHSGRVLGFPGFDVGAMGTIQFRPDKDNTILRNAGVKEIGLPMVQAAVGLPFKFDVIAQGGGGAGAKIYGGGLRWGLHKSAKVSPLPDVSVSGFANRLEHDFFHATHYSINACASIGLPIFKPFVGVGWDHTTVRVNNAVAAALIGQKAVARGERLTGGVDISPLPLLHFFGAYTLLHGTPGVNLGAGVRF